MTEGGLLEDRPFDDGDRRRDGHVLITCCDLVNLMITAGVVLLVGCLLVWVVCLEMRLSRLEATIIPYDELRIKGGANLWSYPPDCRGLHDYQKNVPCVYYPRIGAHEDADGKRVPFFKIVEADMTLEAWKEWVRKNPEFAYRTQPIWAPSDPDSIKMEDEQPEPLKKTRHWSELQQERMQYHHENPHLLDAKNV